MLADLLYSRRSRASKNPVLRAYHLGLQEPTSHSTIGRAHRPRKLSTLVPRQGSYLLHHSSGESLAASRPKQLSKYASNAYLQDQKIISATQLLQCDHICAKFGHFGKKDKVFGCIFQDWLEFGNILNLLWQLY